jgi:outer membrane protein OmpA-like peptidoglycan-associated protein
MKDMAVPLEPQHLPARRIASAGLPLNIWAVAGVAALAAALTVAWPAAAQSPQAVPDTRDMIEALKPGRQRNLIIRQTPPAAPAAASAAPATSTAGPVAPPALPTTPAPAPGTVVAPPALAPSPATAPSTTPAPAAGPVAPPALPTGAPAAPPSLSLAIQFESNSSRVRPESGPVLGNLVAAMLSPDLKSSRFVIEGHTDARGSVGANQTLSQQRADEVRLYLVALGVHPARLKAVGKGSSEPVNPRDPLAGENRRVRVVTLE